MSSSDSSVNSEELGIRIGDVVDLGDVTFERDLPRVRANDPRVTELYVLGWWNSIANMTAEDWEQLGLAISNNTHLEEITFEVGAFRRSPPRIWFRS